MILRGLAMSFRKEASSVVCGDGVALRPQSYRPSVYSTIRRSFEQANHDRANAIAAEFRAEFQRRGSEVVRKVESVAAGETVQRILLI